MYMGMILDVYIGNSKTPGTPHVYGDDSPSENKDGTTSMYTPHVYGDDSQSH